MNHEHESQKDRLYQALVHSVTDYIVGINSDFKVIIANNPFKQDFGLQSGDQCYKAWKKKDQKCENCLVERSFQDGEIHHSEETVIRNDGKAIQMLIKSTPIKNENGSVIYVLESATDITGKRQLDSSIRNHTDNLYDAVINRLESLQKSEEKYRTIFERSRDAILLTDIEGRLIDINRAAIKIFGYESKKEIQSLETATELFNNPTELKTFQDVLAQKGSILEFEPTFKRKDGSLFDASVTSSVITDVTGRSTGLVVMVRDITSRNQAQKKIEKRNARLATLNAIATTVNSSLELNEVLEITIDKILEILESDNIRIYLLDEKRENLILTAWKGLSQDFIDKPYMKTRQVGDGLLGQTILTGETRVADNISRSGDPYVEDFNKEGLKSTIYIPLASNEEQIGVMCASSRTRLKISKGYVDLLTAIGNQIGMAVEKANLYEDVKSAYIELMAAKEQIIRTEKLASLGKLAATIAHEINNPLAAVLTYIRLMMKLVNQNHFGQERIKDISRYLHTMDRETSRCGDIVKNLLDFSRQSKISIGLHPIDEILERSLALLNHDLEINGIHLIKELAPNLPMVRCDFKQIQQVFLNLISNASEAMTKGGSLSIQTRIAQDKNFVEIVFKDTGYGISKKDLENIFEPFFTTKEEGQGVGLGLSVVYGIITQHNGVIRVDSTPGAGSSFYVHLPVA